MLKLLDNLVHTVNSIGSSCFNLFSSFIALNYYVGEVLFNCLSTILVTCFSGISTLFLVLKIMLEDLLVFFKELSESIMDIVLILITCWDHFFNFLSSIFESIGSTIASVFGSISSGLGFMYNVLIRSVQNCGDLFNLIGKSFILLINLVPRTIYLLYAGSIQVFRSSKHFTFSFLNTIHSSLVSASPELLVGLIVGLVGTGLLVRKSIRIIREREITWGTTLRALLWLVCSSYILVFRSIARCVGLTLTMMEMTVSNLRVPMFAHAGDSDDEDEDRENLVGAVEDSDDEENERTLSKRRNYEMLKERAKSRRRGGRRASEDSVEEQLLREVEREREDKLCCVCQDMEKCIMMLPCRHLCICARCQELLRVRTNTCPICRKPVKQMIKAYL